MLQLTALQPFMRQLLGKDCKEFCPRFANHFRLLKHAYTETLSGNDYWGYWEAKRLHRTM